MELALHRDAVRRVCKDASSNVYSAGQDQQVLGHSLVEGKNTYGVRCQAPIYSLAVQSSVGSNAVLLAGDHCGGIYSLDTRVPTRPTEVVKPTLCNAHQSTVRDLLVVDDNGMFLSASCDSTVRLWDHRMTRCSLHCTLHSDAVWTMALLPHTRTMISGSRDGSVVATNLQTQMTSLILRASYPVLRLAVVKNTILWVCTTLLGCGRLFSCFAHEP